MLCADIFHTVLHFFNIWYSKASEILWFLVIRKPCNNFSDSIREEARSYHSDLDNWSGMQHTVCCISYVCTRSQNKMSFEYSCSWLITFAVCLCASIDIFRLDLCLGFVQFCSSLSFSWNQSWSFKSRSTEVINPNSLEWATLVQNRYTLYIRLYINIIIDIWTRKPYYWRDCLDVHLSICLNC